MSRQTDFLDVAINEGPDRALERYPDILREEEKEGFANLNSDDLQKLREVRRTLEQNDNVAAIDGNGIIAF